MEQKKGGDKKLRLRSHPRPRSESIFVDVHDAEMAVEYIWPRAVQIMEKSNYHEATLFVVKQQFVLETFIAPALSDPESRELLAASIQAMAHSDESIEGFVMVTEDFKQEVRVGDIKKQEDPTAKIDLPDPERKEVLAVRSEWRNGGKFMMWAEIKRMNTGTGLKAIVTEPLATDQPSGLMNDVFPPLEQPVEVEEVADTAVETQEDDPTEVDLDDMLDDTEK